MKESKLLAALSFSAMAENEDPAKIQYVTGVADQEDVLNDDGSLREEYAQTISKMQQRMNSGASMNQVIKYALLVPDPKESATALYKRLTS